MESFIEYLISEQVTPDMDEKTWEKIKEILKKKCGPVLKDLKRREVKDLPFIGKWTQFRGPVKIRKTRKDRMPKDTPGQVHELFNEMLYDYTGVRGRSESIFATGRFTQANSYGNVYHVLPVGDYKVVWHPYIEDLYSLWDSDSRFSWAIDVISGAGPDLDPYEMESEWDEIYGPGGNGHWEYSGITVDGGDRDQAVEEVLEEMGIDDDPDQYDVDDYEYNYYRNFEENIRNVQEQKTLFGEHVVLQKFNINPERENDEAYLKRNDEGDFYIETRVGEIIEDKQDNSFFDDKETAWEAFKRHKMKEGVVDYGYPLDLEILSNYYDEDWAAEILDKIIDDASDNIIDDVDNNIEWIPEVTLEEFVEDKESEYGEERWEEANEVLRDIFSGYREGDIHNAIRAEVELMIECDYYMLIKTDIGGKIIEWINNEL